MGAYLTQPKTDKDSTDECSEYLQVGASSMQGWRNSQEDAHNSILNFDTNASLFAVYDGHGGAEVSTYCADKFPAFFKTLKNYKEGNYEQALKDAFLGFDKTLLQPDVIDILKTIANEKNFNQCDESDTVEEDDDDELAELHEEGKLPLDEVMEKYKGHPSMPVLRRLKEVAGVNQSKPQSPVLRGRRAAAIIAEVTNKAVLDPDAKPEGSSTSKAALAASVASTGIATSTTSSSSPNSLTQAKGIHQLVTEKCSSKSKSIDDEINMNNANSEQQQQEQVIDSTDAGVLSTTSKDHKSSQLDKKVLSKGENKIENGTNGNDDAVQSSKMVIDVSQSNEQNGNVSSTENVLKNVLTEKKHITMTNNEVTAFITNDSSSSSGTTNDSKANGKIQDKNTDMDDATISSTNKEDKNMNEQSNSITEGDNATTTTECIVNKQLESPEDGVDENEHNEVDDDEEDYEDDDDTDGIIRFDMNESDDSDDAGYHEEVDDDDDDDDDDDEETCDEEDEETYHANENFCANMIEEPGKDSGCTAVVSLLVGRDLYVANAGDSRCVVCRNGKAIEMSLDHKPEDDEETARIIKAGGRVTLDGRVNGGLNLSRALGDHGYKMNTELPPEEQMISALPDIKKLIITPEDEFMVLACDGIWNFMSSSEVVSFVRHRLLMDNEKASKISKICEELFERCLAPNTMGDGTGCDNMTAVIVRFKDSIQNLETHLRPEETEKVTISAEEEETLLAGRMGASVGVMEVVTSEQQSSPSRAEKRSVSPDSKNDSDKDDYECGKSSAKKMKCFLSEADDGLEDIVKCSHLSKEADTGSEAISGANSCEADSGEDQQPQETKQQTTATVVS